MAMKFYVYFFDVNNTQQKYSVWSDSSCHKEVIQTFEQDYGTHYSQIIEIQKA